jgi:hypothetical protein
MTAEQLLKLVELEGGTVTLLPNGDLHCVDADDFLEALEAMKPAVIRVLEQRNRPKPSRFLDGLGPEELERGAEKWREREAERRQQLREAGQWPEQKTKAERKLERLSSWAVPAVVMKGGHSKPGIARQAKQNAKIREAMAHTAPPQQVPDPAEQPHTFKYQERTLEQYEQRMREHEQFGWKKGRRKKP